jgi:hypothetical protein
MSDMRSELEEVRREIEIQEKIRSNTEKRIADLKRTERILNLKIESQGMIGPKCKSWMKYCAGFGYCKFMEICKGNQIGQGFK